MWRSSAPAGTFGDPDDDPLGLSAGLASGDPLPTWLAFDAVTGTFAGTPPADFDSALDLRVSASDGMLSVDADFTLTINPVNDPPTLNPSAPAFLTINEDATGNGGRTVASPLGAGAGEVDGDVLGIAVTGQSSGNGAWQFSVDNGATWADFDTVAETDALLLRGSNRVRFLPDARNGTIADFTYLAWDQGLASASSSLLRQRRNLAKGQGQRGAVFAGQEGPRLLERPSCVVPFAARCRTDSDLADGWAAESREDTELAHDRPIATDLSRLALRGGIPESRHSTYRAAMSRPEWQICRTKRSIKFRQERLSNCHGERPKTRRIRLKFISQRLRNFKLNATPCAPKVANVVWVSTSKIP